MVGRRPTTKRGAQRLLHRCHAHDGREECGGGDGEHAVAGGADAVDAKKEYEQVEMDGSRRGSDAGVKNAHFIDIKKLGSLMSGFFFAYNRLHLRQYRQSQQLERRHNQVGHNVWTYGHFSLLRFRQGWEVPPT